MRNRKPRNKTRVVGIRIDEEVYAELARLKINVSEYVREIIAEARAMKRCPTCGQIPK